MHIQAVLLIICIFLVTGCGPAIGVAMMGAGVQQNSKMNKKNEAMMEIAGNPDLPEWNEKREKIAQAMGDKVIDKPYDGLFPAMMVAVSSLEVQINTSDKSSGLISGTGTVLPPQVGEPILKEGLREYCTIKGYSPSLVDEKGYGPSLSAVASFKKDFVRMTVVMVKQGASQTKVKLRFTGVNYPGALEAVYAYVWPALDKQIFMDKNLD